MSWNIRHSLAALLSLLAFGLLVEACTYNDAELHCKHEGGYLGEALTACEIGATQVGPAHSTIEDADSDCKSRYNVRSIPYTANVQAWSDGMNSMINKYNGCHWGAAAHLYTTNPGDAGAIFAGGCVQELDGGGNVICHNSEN